MKRFQRVVQAITLTVFLLLLAAAGFPLAGYLPFDGFLRMDPVAGAVASISARQVIAAFWPALVVIAGTFLLGRFFCGYVCPMGTTIDMADRAAAPRRLARDSPDTHRRWSPVPYILLSFLLGSAALGVSLVFVASPLALITRFYGNLVMPVLALFVDGLLRAAAALPPALRPDAVVSASFPVNRFAHAWFLVIFFGGIFAAATVAQRFWCRYLCPAGAVLSLCSRRPLIRRQVTEDCIDCGQCQQGCPMGAIDDQEARRTQHSACIACQRCVAVCPVAAVSFTGGMDRDAAVSLDRRRILGSGVAGAAAAMVSLTGLTHLHGPAGAQMIPPDLIRPPGSLPEDAFLARCLRCGACLAACPTNTLQPLGLAIGFTGLFSPVLTPRRGPCEPGCNVCGWVCPSGAIRALPLREKTWAKMGTAHILKEQCLAWEFNRRCLVCDEVCPYDAVALKQEKGHAVGVPVVDEDRCAGCGLCEHHCPVRGAKAIVVGPMGELRLATGSYRDAARAQGLSLVLAVDRAARVGTSQSTAAPVLGYPAASGETERPGAGDSLPPGFTR